MFQGSNVPVSIVPGFQRFKSWPEIEKAGILGYDEHLSRPGGVAQRLEQAAHIRCVGGSNPSTAITFSFLTSRCRGHCHSRCVTRKDSPVARSSRLAQLPVVSEFRSRFLVTRSSRLLQVPVGSGFGTRFLVTQSPRLLQVPVISGFRSRFLVTRSSRLAPLWVWQRLVSSGAPAHRP